VTGGAGFIGSHLVEALVARGDTVTILDDGRNANAEENLAAVASNVTVFTGDCTSASDALDAANPDTVFHLAAPAYVPPSIEDPLADMRGNVEQTLHLLNSLRVRKRAPRLVHVSSAAIYGHPNVQPIRETYPPAPVSPYGVDKFAAEEHVRVASLIHGIRAVVLRYFPVYGPRQRKQVVYDLIAKLDADPTTLEVHGTGRELRDLCFVDDIVRGTIGVGEAAPGRGEAINLGSGHMVTIEHVARTICDVLGVEPEIRFTGSVRPGDAERIVADVTKARTFGFESRVTLRDGIERTIAWMHGQPARAARGVA
jgi:UDP-glucose 4-epimerase